MVSDLNLFDFCPSIKGERLHLFWWSVHYIEKSMLIFYNSISKLIFVLCFHINAKFGSVLFSSVSCNKRLDQIYLSKVFSNVFMSMLWFFWNTHWIQSYFSYYVLLYNSYIICHKSMYLFYNTMTFISVLVWVSTALFSTKSYCGPPACHALLTVSI